MTDTTKKTNVLYNARTADRQRHAYDVHYNKKKKLLHSVLFSLIFVLHKMFRNTSIKYLVVMALLLVKEDSDRAVNKRRSI